VAGVFVGIDPGGGGGIAAVDRDGAVVLAIKMPETDQDIKEALRQLALPRAIIEHVHSSPQMGVVSAFSFGGSYRALKMAMTCLCIPYEEVQPRKWQEAMRCRLPGGKGFGERDSGAAKKLTRQRAQELFPRQKVTHGIADALLIAEYCRRIEVRPGG
jgi:hypothetical protein